MTGPPGHPYWTPAQVLGALAIVAVHLVAMVSVRLDLVDELSRIFGGE